MTTLSPTVTETFRLLQILCRGNGRTAATNAWLSKRRGLSKYSIILHLEALAADGWIWIKKDARARRQIFVEHGDLEEVPGGFRLVRTEKIKELRPLFYSRKTHELYQNQ
jgi:hypothetical protein